jgi:hypothetical protein
MDNNSLYLKKLGDRSGLDLCDLIHGEGEWKNMQDVIRRSFLLSFDQIQKQQEQISKLVDVVTNLRSQLSKKPCRDDIQTMIDTSISNMKSHRYAKTSEIDEMKTKIIDFQTDLERKASIRYVDDSVKRKLDKTDNSLRVLSSFSGTQFNAEMTKFASELGDFRARTEILGINVHEIGHELRCTAKEIDVRSMQAQIEDLFAMVNECPTKSQLNPIMSNKVDLSELDSLLLKKMDKSNFDANLSRLEQAILDQDKIVTSIRVRFNDESMFAMPITSSKINYNENNNNNNKSNINHSKVNVEDLVKPENDHINIIPIIQEGRMEVVISSMWQKIINLQNECQDNRGLIKNLDELLLRTDAINKSSANLKQVETLAVILEEQKQRTDLIICGALTISPINEALDSICKEMEGIQKYLGLPQNQPLTQQLTEAGDLVDSLANRIGDFGTALGRAGIRIESSEKILSQLDNRINLVESNSSDNNFFKTQIQGEINISKNASNKINELESVIFKIQQDQKNILETHGSTAIHKNRIDSLESSITKLQVVKKQFEFNSTQFDNLQDLTDFIERLSISISDIKSYMKIEKKQNKLNNSNNSNNYNQDDNRSSIDIDLQNRSLDSRISENNYISKKVNPLKQYSESNLDSVREPSGNTYMRNNTNFNNNQDISSSVDHVDERLKMLQNEKDRLRKKLEKHVIVGL